MSEINLLLYFLRIFLDHKFAHRQKNQPAGWAPSIGGPVLQHFSLLCDSIVSLLGSLSWNVLSALLVV